MPTTNARKHVIPSGADQSITRSTIFESFGNSIRDVVGVANTTERAQLVTDLNAKGQGPTVQRPLVVHRADAPGLHRIEYTVDGSVWLPASGTLAFSTKAAADSFGTANGGLLSVGDLARVGSTIYRWSGTAFGQQSAVTASGSVALTTTTGGGSSPIFWSDLFDVTFPAGLFTAAPQVVAQTIGPSGQVAFGGVVEQITTTGCKVRGMRVASVPGSGFSVQWVAVQA